MDLSSSPPTSPRESTTSSPASSPASSLPTSPPAPTTSAPKPCTNRNRPLVERVYGELKTIVHTRKNADTKSAVTRIAVHCPYCGGVHLHQPTRSRLTQPLTYDYPPSTHPSSLSGLSSNNTITYAYLNTHVTNPLLERKVNWETDRVALCKRGTYHIVGWSEPHTLSQPVQPMRRTKDAEADALNQLACYDRHMRQQTVKNVAVLEVLRRPHMGRGVMIR